MIVSTFLVNAGDPADPKVYSMVDVTPKATRNMELDQVIQWAEHDPFWIYRGKAIQGYAHLESALCALLVAVSDMKWEAAATIFYKITNTSARNSILEKLLHHTFGAKFNPFWNPLSQEIRALDLKRNEIVHWLAAATVMFNSNTQLMMGITLVPPASIHHKGSRPQITANDLIEFARKCDETSAALHQFAMRLKPPDAMPDKSEPWLDIYQLPLTYPLPEGHPLKLPAAKPRTHPQSFPASLVFLHPTPDGKGLQFWLP